jgi:hypothetical protein
MNADMQEQIRAAQREYHKQWRAKNPDKVKACKVRYWLEKAEQMKQEVNADERNTASNE